MGTAQYVPPGRPSYSAGKGTARTGARSPAVNTLMGVAYGYGPVRGPFPPPAKIFSVGVYSGFRVRRWPFARFYVSPAGLQVTAPKRGSRLLWVPREAVIVISAGRGMYGNRLKIADAAGAMAGIGIEVPFGRRKIIAELRRCGYVVNEPRVPFGKLPF